MKTIFHFHLIIITSVLLSVDSCKNKKETTSASTSTTTQQTATTPVSTPSVTPVAVNTASVTPKDDNARFIASFYSIGQGIDSETQKEFEKFLNTYPNPKKINYEAKHWGREGETDYCLKLKELTETEQDEFVRKAKKILSYNVNVIENSKRTHGQQTDDKFRVIFSFFSIGEGINAAVQEKFEKYAASYSPKVAHEAAKWGREGELDYCFKLSELSTAQQEEFVMKAQEIVSKRVHISENDKCKH